MKRTTADVSDFQPFHVTKDIVAGEVHWLVEGVSGVWRVDEGQLPDEVPYVFRKPETIHVLEGTVHITTEDGGTATYGVGDIAAYPAGVRSTWKFGFPFRKFVVYV